MQTSSQWLMISKPCTSILPGSLKVPAQPSVSIFAERKSFALLLQLVLMQLGENLLTNWLQKKKSLKTLRYLIQCPTAKSGEMLTDAMEHFATKITSVSQAAADPLSLLPIIDAYQS